MRFGKNLGERITLGTKNMIEGIKKKIAQRLTTRVSTGLMFIEFNYLNSHPTPDSAWIRNIYILLSFYTELLLKAIIVITGNFNDSNAVDSLLRKLGHNLEDIGKYLGPSLLSDFGIKEIRSVGHEYVITTPEGTFNVMDFQDIRYDFLDDRVRVIKGDEHDMFKRQIEIMYRINRQLKPLAW